MSTGVAETPTFHEGRWHRIAHQVHRLHHWCPATYLRIWGSTLRRFPPSALKQRMINSLSSYPWPTIALPPRRVEIAAGHQITVHPYTGDLSFQAHVSRSFYYEPGLAEWLATRQYDVILEIGANVGIYTCFLAQLFPQAAIYAFEPSRMVYHRLLENLALNPTANVQPYCLAVSDCAGFASFFEPEGHNTNGTLVPAMARIFSETISRSLVPTIGPEQLAALIPSGRRVLVKLDIEAAEPTVLRALQPLLMERRPDLVAEVLDITAAEFNGIDYLRTVYQPHQIQPDGSLRPVSVFSIERGYADFVMLARPQ